MRSRAWARLAVSLLPGFCLVCLLTGCASEDTFTGRLWQPNYATRFQPSTSADIRLFDRPDHADVLVVYTEKRGTNGVTRPRAFFLARNESKIEAEKKPHFVRTNSICRLEPIPLLSGDADASKINAPVWARISTNAQSFTLVRDGQERGEFKLPDYPARPSKLKCVLLTPGTVVIDGGMFVGIVGGVLGLSFLCARGDGSAGLASPEYGETMGWFLQLD